MSKASSRVALVAGSSGIAGRQLVNTLLHRGWEVIGFSHRALSRSGATPMIHVDLHDARHSAQTLQPLSTVTHIFYSAWMNAGNWGEMAEPNVTTLRNLISHVEQNAPLQTISLMQGYKVHGAHLGSFKTPTQESDPGVPGARLNAAQPAWLHHFQQGKTWYWSTIGPGVVDSPVPGDAMNLALSIALYASLCKALDLPLHFPGMLTIWHSTVDHADADLLAEATLWAATSPTGENEAFNANNGDIWRWCELRPRIAQWLEPECVPPVRPSFCQLFNDYRAVWRELAGERLMEADTLRLSDGQLADFVFDWQYDTSGDGSKLRRAGFQRMQATDEMFSGLFSQLRAARVIPWALASGRRQPVLVVRKGGDEMVGDSPHASGPGQVGMHH